MQDSLNNTHENEQISHDDFSLPMNWYKFLRYFALIFGGGMLIINGIAYIISSTFISETDFSTFTLFTGETYNSTVLSLKVLSIACGILCIFTGLFNFYTRSRLAKYKKNAPLCVITVYALNNVETLLYLTVASIASGESSFFFGLIFSAVIGLVMCTANYFYFKKRKFMFEG